MNKSFYEEKKRFNAIDAFIVLILLVMIAVLIFRSQIIALFNDTGTQKDCEIYFTCESIPMDIYPQITSGSAVTWLESDASLGRLTMISQEPEKAKIYEQTENGLIYRESFTDYEFKGKINGTAISNHGCYIDGTDFLAAGMTITIVAGHVQFTALITAVNFI